ncbi:hypothetical protein [Pseudoduganella violacea]|uniref:Uncharacterized protein n=1 Tax=Pseudoduganella violacea TaxID=1715466 RepID=A0A7W5FWL0_9BURK|nr:hypothetical protein [Pseudoduganella violacea]MBB3121388.1 hypothetical protein [Pseudoduganella violacea]
MRRLILSAALLLSACGGGGGHGGMAAPSDPPAPPVVAADVFLSLVQTRTGASDEESEPVDLDALAATSPEDAEPVPL